MNKKVFESDENVKGGEPVFPNTRVPISLLFAELKAGHDIGYFLEGYPTVTKEQVLALLEVAEESLLVAQSAVSVHLDTKEELERLRQSLALATEALLVTAGNYPKEKARAWVNQNILED